MKFDPHSKRIRIYLFLVFVSLLVLATSAVSQTTPLLKRTTFKNDNLDFGSGGTFAIAGAPKGAITIEGWQKNEIEITAEIEVQAASEDDLARLAEVTGFVLDESMGRTGIISVGTHDKKYIKQAAKKFPKHLLGMPFRIDYRIKVPHYCDLEIDGGIGDLVVTGVDGTLMINFLNTNAKIDLLGGITEATFGTGTVDVTIPTRSWRGRSANVQLGSGTMNVHLPLNLNAEIDATISRTGKIENAYNDLKPRTRTGKFTEKSIVAKAGAGGISLKFTVADGNLNILEFKKLTL